jgi:hypothetical protein
MISLSIEQGAGATKNFLHERHTRPMHDPIVFKISRPLLSIAASSAITNETAAALSQQIESGNLLAFNIAPPGTGRRCLRIHAASLADYIKGTIRRPSSQDVRTQVSNLFPALSATIRTENLVRFFDCGNNLLLELVRHKCLKLANVPRRGNGGIALFTRSSCIEFLLARRQ